MCLIIVLSFFLGKKAFLLSRNAQLELFSFYFLLEILLHLGDLVFRVVKRVSDRHVNFGHGLVRVLMQ